MCVWIEKGFSVQLSDCPITLFELTWPTASIEPTG